MAFPVCSWKEEPSRGGAEREGGKVCVERELGFAAAGRKVRVPPCSHAPPSIPPHQSAEAQGVGGLGWGRGAPIKRGGLTGPPTPARHIHPVLQLPTRASASGDGYYRFLQLQSFISVLNSPAGRPARPLTG